MSHNMEYIRNGRGNTIGYILDIGSEVGAFTQSGARLGRYVPGHNATYDARGNKIGNGNQLMRLF